MHVYNNSALKAYFDVSY